MGESCERVAKCHLDYKIHDVQIHFVCDTLEFLSVYYHTLKHCNLLTNLIFISNYDLDMLPHVNEFYNLKKQNWAYFYQNKKNMHFIFSQILTNFSNILLVKYGCKRQIYKLGLVDELGHNMTLILGRNFQLKMLTVNFQSFNVI